jgi:hypothetical protein
MPNVTMSVSPTQVDFLVSGKIPVPVRTDLSFEFTVPKPPKGLIIPRFDLPQTSAPMESIATAVLGDLKIATPMFAAAS